MPNHKIRPIALYLPQFHPIPENDEWWGKGFTEWRNVVKAKPRFKGHYQPHLPADLGYYDLRLEEARLAQEALAKQYGIYGFCYYHYWFNGKRLLSEPIDRKMKNPKEDLPFMFCWANENWTRAWDGGEHEILIEQKYSYEDDVNHIRALIPYFKDERYIKVDGKPVFVIYKDALFPDIKRTLETFRNVASKQGLELYVCRFDRQIHTSLGNPELLHFNAAIEFQPLSFSIVHYRQMIQLNQKRTLQRMKINKYLNPIKYLNFFKKRILNIEPPIRTIASSDEIVNFPAFVEFDLQQKKPQYKTYPCVSPGWDNSARRPEGKALIFKDSSPTLFKKWIQGKLQNFQAYSDEENFLFINAWNEWAEGNHLEPCEKYGFEYLEAVKECMETNSNALIT